MSNNKINSSSPSDEDSLPGRIFLIGFMGSGKTTVGKHLAKLIGYEFIDMDTVVETDEGMAIRDIFIKRGEHHFRNQESRLLDQLSTREHIVISCGGGIIHDTLNIERLKEFGPAIFLDGNAKLLFERVKGDDNRPFAFLDLEDEQERFLKFADLYEKRRSHYQEASLWTIDVNDKTPAEIAEEIKSKF